MSHIQGAIAVVGLSCRYPGASSLQAFWDNILAQRTQFRSYPKERLPSEHYFSEEVDAVDKSYLDRAAFLDGWLFDRIAWRIPQSTWDATDPAHWLALELADDALRHAGGKERFSDGRTAVYVGNTLTGEFTRSRSMRLRWPYVGRTLARVLEQHDVPKEQQNALLQHFQQAYQAPFAPTSEDTLAGGLSNTIAGRICGHFDFRGGGYTVDGACSSSLLAVATAVERLATKEIDMALAGGVDISLDPFELVGFAKAGALCREELRIYDERASGMIPGEGAGFVVLKRLEDARRDRDMVYAVIRGWGISSDGKGAITAPKAEGQSIAVSTAWKRAGYTASDLNFVEGHGTGTALGDPTEILGISKAQATLKDERTPSCGLTSLKSIVGHTKAAAGIGAFIKSVLCVNQRIIPPTARCERPHQVFSELDGTVYPVRYGKVYEPTTTLRGGVSAMGFGGINAHVTVESADAPSPLLRASAMEETLLRTARSAEVIVGTADTKEGLIEAVRELRLSAAGMADGELVDLSAHTWKQAVSTWRFAVVATSARDLLQKLEGLEAHLADNQSLPKDTFVGSNSDRPRVGVVFPGQGSHAPNMARRTLSSPDARESLQSMFEAMSEHHAVALREALHPEEHQLDHTEYVKTLARTELAQPAITWASYAWWSWLQELDVQPEKVAGHSLGELMALYAAGAIERTQLFQLAALRGAAMIGDGRDGMLVLKCGAEDAAVILKEAETQEEDAERPDYALIANKNGHQQTVIAGQLAALEQVMSAADRKGVVCRRLSVSRAFHSGLMKDAAQKMSTVDYPSTSTLQSHWVSSVEPTRTWDSVDLQTYLTEQVTAPVDFTGVMEQFSDMDLILEVGPGRTLSGLCKRHGGPVCLPLEGRFGADEYTCQAVATLFVMNAPVRGEALFAHRFVRPFVPASERVFLTNPCETFADDSPVSLPDLSAPVEVTESPTQERVSPHQSVLEQLLALIEQQTGFPTSTLRPEHRLLDDLHLDSIKSGELIARVAQMLDCAGRVDPLELANARLDEIALALEEAQSYGSGHVEHIDSWVAAFASKRVSVPAPECSLLEAWRGHDVELIDLSSGVSRQIGTFLESIHCKQTQNSVRKIVCMPAEDFAVGCLIEPLVKLAHTLSTDDQVVIVDPSPSPCEGGMPTRMDGVRAFASSLHLERPDLGMYIVSIPAVGAVEELVETAFASLDATQSFGYVEQHGVEAPETLQMHYVVEPKTLLPMPEGVVLATGGARGITARCIIKLAQEQGGRFALVGRSPLGDEAKETLSQLQEAGAEAYYYRADICRQEEVIRLVREVEGKQGPISWLFHGAGINKPRRASTVSEEEARKEIAPKLRGMECLLDAIPGTQLQRITALTSIIGEVGMQGNAWYAYSNESLHRLLALWNKRYPHAVVRCLASSVWGEVGMGARMGSVEQLKTRGIEAIPPDEGARLSYLWACAAEGPSQVFLTARLGREALDTWRQPVPSYQGPMVQNVLEETPEVEACFSYHLTAEKDAYLNDHVFEGTILFPTVFAVEWMAQGVRRVFGHELGTFELRDLKLSRPVVVDPKEGVQVRLHVLRVGDECFRCAIFCESTGFSIAHFEGYAWVEQPQPRERHVHTLPILRTATAPQEDLYGSLLFQGERFQRLQEIRSLEAEHCTLRVDHDGLQAEGPWFIQDEQLLLGSPYVRDAMLQSGQLLITPRQGLPVAVDRWVFPVRQETSAHVIDVVILDDQTEEVTARVLRMGDEGDIVEKIEGYQIKVLQTISTLPSVEELCQRSSYVSGLINRCVEETARGYGLSLSPLKVLHMEGVGHVRKQQRRELAQELVGAPLVWDKDGKPSLQSGGHVSITHDGALLLSVQAEHPVGVDIIELAGQPWRDMTAAMYDSVTKQAPQLSTPGAHIWAAREALAKLSGQVPTSLEVVSGRETDALFSSEGHQVLTFQFSCCQSDWILALTCPVATPVKSQSSVVPNNHVLSLYTFEDHARGERDETIFKYRFPMTFDAAGNPSGGVHFAQLIHWIGHTREIGIRPSGLYQAAINHVASGQYAWVTKETALRIVGSANAGDLIEVECWNERMYGTDDASLEMIYQWYSVSPEGTRRRLAESAQTTTWARVLGHGIVESTPYPDDMEPWLAASLPSHAQGTRGLSWSSADDVGAVLWEAAPGPQPGMFLTEESFRTTPRNGNMVGNVYWANYFDWMGEVRDLWAQAHVPFGEGELRCTGTEIQHLREAMPGDQVVVKMYLEKRCERGFGFSFSFFREDPEGLTKLAQGHQTASWFVPRGGSWEPGEAFSL